MIFKRYIEKLKITTGKEFTTGRIIDGKVEYGKIINVGNLPNATTKNINTGISNLKDLTFGIVSITSGAGSRYTSNLRKYSFTVYC